MNNKKIYILGAGGMAREVYSYYLDMKSAKRVAGFVVEDRYAMPDRFCGKKVIRPKQLLRPELVLLIAAIGSPLKERWVESLEKAGYHFDTLVHPNSNVARSAKIGEGSIICPGVIISPDVIIGKHALVNIGSTLSHDCELGSFCVICPGVNIGGYSKVGASSWVGIGATVSDRVNIGNSSFIGAKAAVLRDVADKMLAYGVPAKPIRKIGLSDWGKFI